MIVSTKTKAVVKLFWLGLAGLCRAGSKGANYNTLVKWLVAWRRGRVFVWTVWVLCEPLCEHCVSLVWPRHKLWKNCVKSARDVCEFCMSCLNCVSCLSGEVFFRFCKFYIWVSCELCVLCVWALRMTCPPIVRCVSCLCAECEQHMSYVCAGRQKTGL